MSEIDESLEQLLSTASPRTVPSEADVAVARETVRAEWRAVSAQQRNRKGLFRLAVAATVLIGVFSLFNVFRAPTDDFVRVASIQKSFGSVYVLGDHSELTLADNLTAVHAGQTIITGGDAGMALSWGNGGSVRIDKETQIEFGDNDTVRLHSGRIYFDSSPSELINGITAGGIDEFRIETEHGVVSHVGTQFMTEVNSEELRISVREGLVDVVGHYYSHTASHGEQVVYSGRQRPAVLSIAVYGDSWDWVAGTSPTITIDGISVHAVLTWAGRELGRSIEYADSVVETAARDDLLNWSVDKDPAEALRWIMLTTALDWSYEEGVIYVSNSD